MNQTPQAPGYRDPVFMDANASWWFYNETWDGVYGPYVSETEARTRMGEYAAWLESQRASQVQVEAPRQVSANDLLVAEYLRLKQDVEDLTKQQKDALDPMKRELELLENKLLATLNELGVDKFEAGGVTVFTTARMFANTSDASALKQYIRESGDVDLLGNRVSSTVLREWMAAHGNQVPPGVKVSFERTLSVRRK